MYVYIHICLFADLMDFVYQLQKIHMIYQKSLILYQKGPVSNVGLGIPCMKYYYIYIYVYLLI